jgi:N4-gp56 family major capsid protein
MAVELIGAGGMSAELKQTYDRILLSVAEQNLVFLNYGEKRNIPPRGGKSIEFRRFEKIALGTHVLTEGTVPTETQATISTVAATISQYGAYSKISDLLEFQAFDPIIAEYTEKWGIHMAEVLDTVVRDVVSAATTVQYADDATVVGTSGAGAVGSGNYLDAAELLEAKRTLARNNAKPINGHYICFIHPDNTKDLYEDADIINAFQYAAERGPNNPLSTGVLGDWMGIRFVETTNLKVNPSYGMSGADVYEVLMFGKEAYAVTELDAMQARTIIHDKRTEGGALEVYSTIGWKAALAAVILNQDWIVKIYCASSRTPAA